MANLQAENLEERMERIRKRNEELEKKYREAEEDRLMALKDNAMVEIKPPKDEDWPREHKYDKLDFTYDQKEVAPENACAGGDTDENGTAGKCFHFFFSFFPMKLSNSFFCILYFFSIIWFIMIIIIIVFFSTYV